MRYSWSAAALFAATASADLCALGSTDVNGNWYCQLVRGISYKGVGTQATYNKITSMDSITGKCTSTPHVYSGPVAPLDEELSMHFRGPIKVEQIAVYTLGCDKEPSSYSKVKRSAHERRHGHHHGHLHQREEKRDPGLGDTVEALIDGKVVHWKNTYSGGASGSQGISNAGKDALSGSLGSNAPKAGSSSSSGKSSSKSGSASSSSSSTCNGSGKGWSRVASYNAANQSANGMVFLNHRGGSGSGTFDTTFGNSLSYASPDGNSGSSTPQILADTTITSKTEVVVMSDKKCDDGDACGYFRSGTVAYEGFGGANKAFFIEFMMPDDGTHSADIYSPTNMPAIWFLNAQIPRTAQYGPKECSCWGSGCGELDVAEVLAPGDTRCKSTIHGNKAGGDSDYFARPTTKPIKAAVLFYEDNIHIKILDDATVFGDVMPDSFVNEIVADTMTESAAKGVSLFKLGG